MCTVFVVEAVALWFRACRLNQEVASCTMQRAFCLGRLTKKSRVSHFLLHTCHTLWQRSVWPRLTWRVFIYGCVIVFKFVLSHRVGFNEALLWGTDFIDIWRAQSRGWLAHWRRALNDWTRLMTTEMSFKVRESRSDVNNRPEAQKRIQLCLMNSFIGSTQNNIRILCSGWCYKQFPVSCCEVRVISANTLCALLAKTNKNIW